MSSSQAISTNYRPQLATIWPLFPGASKIQKALKHNKILWRNKAACYLWGGAIQGVTELKQRERCKDDWWNEVVDELRAGALSERNYRYLHGYKVDGCKLTEEERNSRQRVITSADDPRLQESRFKEAVAIVANNDARYQINKDRAKHYSRASGAPLRWAAAIDTATTEALQAELCDKEAKIRCGVVFVFWSSH